MNIDKLADTFDPFADHSAAHIYDQEGTFCGKRHGDFTRGISHVGAPAELDTHLFCQECSDALRVARERDS